MRRIIETFITDRKLIISCIIGALLILGTLGSGIYIAERWSNDCQYTYSGQMLILNTDELSNVYSAMTNADKEKYQDVKSFPFIINYEITVAHNIDTLPFEHKQPDSSWVAGLIIATAGTLWVGLLSIMAISQINS